MYGTISRSMLRGTPTEGTPGALVNNFWGFFFASKTPRTRVVQKMYTRKYAPPIKLSVEKFLFRLIAHYVFLGCRRFGSVELIFGSVDSSFLIIFIEICSSFIYFKVCYVCSVHGNDSSKGSSMTWELRLDVYMLKVVNYIFLRCPLCVRSVEVIHEISNNIILNFFPIVRDSKIYVFRPSNVFNQIKFNDFVWFRRLSYNPIFIYYTI